MLLRTGVLCISILIAGTISAQNVYDIKTSYYGEKPERGKTADAVRGKSADAVRMDEEKAKGDGVITGFTGGMKLHAGYAFASSPDELFRNGSLDNTTNLPKDGITLGLGGELRLHFIKHVHLGVEGGMSTMPLMKSGSSIRNGWGGALCDFYGQVGKAQLFIGGLIGGGTSKRLYVPTEETVVADVNAIVYNASYTTIPYFLLDPYVGMEFSLSKRMSLLIQIDYMLPFGNGGKGLNTETVRWSNFLSPSGPRLYVGVLFGKHDER